ncbi:MAG: hypothetical protein O3C63_00845 [Cyanobacteria bacterium]|nr:hypothetical protein [Cyanobacteriota bacterium]
MGRLGQSRNFELAQSVKELSASSGVALACAVEHVQAETSPTNSEDGVVRSAFAELGSKFVGYLRDLKESQAGKGLDHLLNSTLCRFPILKHTERDKLNADAKVIATRLKGYDYTGAHPKILERIEEIHRLLEWYQEGHGKEFLEKEFGIKTDQLTNYIFEMLGKAHDKLSPPRDIVIKLASRDVQGTRHDYAGVDKGKQDLKAHVRFLDKLEEALIRTDLPAVTHMKLTAMREYALDKTASAREIGQACGHSGTSLVAWIKRWNNRTSGGDPEEFFKNDWKRASPKRRQEAVS